MAYSEKMAKMKREISWSILLVIFFLPFSSVLAQYDQNAGSTTIINSSSSFVPIVIGGSVRVVEIALGILVVYIVFIVIIAGILFITSNGDENRMDTAIRWWKRSAVGLVVAPIMYVLVNIVGDVLKRVG